MSWILDTDNFSPHGMCLFWDPDLVAFMIISHLAIALAYMAIPVQLALTLGRPSFLPAWARLLMIAFIVLCGIGHAVDVLTLFKPYYWVQAIVDGMTAVVSVSTAVMLPVAIVHPRS